MIRPEDRYGELNLTGIKMYLEHGCCNYLGGFTFALINNDLKDACAAADHINIDLIPVYVHWLYNNAPAGSWGFSGASSAWLETCKDAESNIRRWKSDTEKTPYPKDWDIITGEEQ